MGVTTPNHKGALMPPLTYRPWQAKAGMAGTYQHLVRSWGNPNAPQHAWPVGVLGLVCERGAPQTIRYDRECVAAYSVYSRILKAEP